MDSLAKWPRRCPVAPEHEAFDVELRQIMHGPFRIIFTIIGRDATILHVRHAARRTLEDL
jgi:hypothetical protein